MSKLKLVVALMIVGFLGLQYTFIAQAQELPKDQMKKDQTNNNSKNQTTMNSQNKFEFQPLPYSYDALEPFIDKLTVEIHYSKHHKAYYDNFMNAIKGTNMESMDIIDIFRNISKYPMAVRNNSGGYFNHTFYWENMKAHGGGLPTGKLSESITKTFGSFEEFKKQFSDAGKTRFGSGWAWLCLDDKGTLFICSTANQDNPLMDIAEKKGIPLLTIDVWEHAYYLKYQNKRADYIDAFWNIVNWEEVAKRYEIALKSLGIK
ncbi:MAG: superoxide dismutase [Bacteroidales bacterium]